MRLIDSTKMAIRDQREFKSPLFVKKKRYFGTSKLKYWITNWDFNQLLISVDNLTHFKDWYSLFTSFNYLRVLCWIENYILGIQFDEKIQSFCQKNRQSARNSRHLWEGGDQMVTANLREPPLTNPPFARTYCTFRNPICGISL